MVMGAGSRPAGFLFRPMATSQFSMSFFRIESTGLEPKDGRITCSRTCTARAVVEGFIPRATRRSSHDFA